MVRPRPNAAESSGPGHSEAPSVTGYPAHPYSVPHHAAVYGAEPHPAPYPPTPNVGAPHYPDVDADEAQPMPYPPPTGTAPVPFPPTRPPPTPPPAVLMNNKVDGAYEQWSSELFDFDMSQDYAIATAICPCVTFGQIAEIIDEGQTSCLLAGTLYMVMIPAVFTCSALSSNYRRKLREKYNLVEAPSNDCTVHLINPCCALCQEYRELQKRGFDPSLGWEANMAQQQHDAVTAPPRNQFMSI